MFQVSFYIDYVRIYVKKIRSRNILNSPINHLVLIVSQNSIPYKSLPKPEAIHREISQFVTLRFFTKNLLERSL